MQDQEELTNLIEKKFRNIKLELKTIAYIARRDHSLAASFAPDVFTVRPYAEIFKAVAGKSTTLQKDVLTAIVMRRAAKDDREAFEIYIDKVYKTKVSGVTPRAAAAMVEDLKAARDSRVLLGKVGEIVYNVGDFDLARAKERLREALASDSAQNRAVQGDYLEDYAERRALIDEQQADPGKYRGVETGIREFDEASGGIMAGELAVLIAQTGMGKSMALGNLSINAWLRGKSVVYYSLEMTKHQIQYRMDARLARLPHEKFRKASLGNLDKKKWGERLNILRERVSGYLEVVCLPRGCTARDVEERASRIQDRRRRACDLIVVDYINLMNPNSSRYGSREWSGQANIAYDLKGVATDFNGGRGVAAWTANQMTDEYEGKGDIKTRHMKYSRGIAEVAQVVLGLSQSADEFLDGYMKLEVVKCRDFKKVPHIRIFPNLDMMMLNDERRSAFGGSS